MYCLFAFFTTIPEWKGKEGENVRLSCRLSLGMRRESLIGRCFIYVSDEYLEKANRKIRKILHEQSSPTF